MDIRIHPRRLSGAVTPPPSKSVTHRLLLAAALASGESTIHNAALSQDIDATLRCLTALGAHWTREGDTLRVTGIADRRNSFTDTALPHFDCGESGSTLRFFLPVALAVAHGGVFTGSGRLMRRPLTPYFDLFAEKGVSFDLDGDTLTVRGSLAAGEYRLAGNVSSQFFTGLLFALPLLGGESTVVATTPLESAGYLDLTRFALFCAGISVEIAAGRAFRVRPAPYRAFTASVEPDWSQAAFWCAAQGLGSALTINGLSARSVQPDRAMLDYAALLRGAPPSGGATPAFSAAAGNRHTPFVGNISIDISRSPDLAPPLAAWGALLNGTLTLENAARLRLKESDRLATITAALRALGAEVYEERDRLKIVGKPTLTGGTVDSANDHRIAMLAAVAATGCTSPVTVLGADCVKKSYPDFWEVYRSLGGEFDVL